MNTNTQPQIHVWTDENGAKFAAEQSENATIYFVEYETYARGEIVAQAESTEQLEAIVTGCFHAKTYINRPDSMSWIEARELERAARDKNPTPERSLADAISYPERCKIDGETYAALLHLLTKGCRKETRETIARRLASLSSLKNYGIYDRLQISPTVSYCAGQDYPAEIRTIRELLIKN